MSDTQPSTTRSHMRSDEFQSLPVVRSRHTGVQLRETKLANRHKRKNEAKPVQKHARSTEFWRCLSTNLKNVAEKNKMAVRCVCTLGAEVKMNWISPSSPVFTTTGELSGPNPFELPADTQILYSVQVCRCSMVKLRWRLASWMTSPSTPSSATSGSHRIL